MPPVFVVVAVAVAAVAVAVVEVAFLVDLRQAATLAVIRLD